MNQQRHIAADWLSMKRACLDLWEKAMEKERKVLMKEQDVIEREKKLHCLDYLVVLFKHVYYTPIKFSSLYYKLEMRSRRNNGANTRGRNHSQQADDVIKIGSNQANNAQVPGNARKRVKGQHLCQKFGPKLKRVVLAFNLMNMGNPFTKQPAH
nr:hypothetical protein [Tanacetum cinerariifolium]